MSKVNLAVDATKLPIGQRFNHKYMVLGLMHTVETYSKMVSNKSMIPFCRRNWHRHLVSQWVRVFDAPRRQGWSLRFGEKCDWIWNQIFSSSPRHPPSTLLPKPLTNMIASTDLPLPRHAKSKPCTIENGRVECLHEVLEDLHEDFDPFMKIPHSINLIWRATLLEIGHEEKGWIWKKGGSDCCV